MSQSIQFTWQTYTAAPLVSPPKALSQVWELSYMEKGSATLHTPFGKWDLNEGSYALLPPGTVRYMTGDGRVSHLTFSVGIVSMLSEQVAKELLDLFTLHAGVVSVLLTPADELYHTLHPVFAGCFDEMMTKDLCYDLRLVSGLSLAFSHLLVAYHGESREDERPVYHNLRRLSSAIRYMQENISSHILVEELSSMVGLTSDYFAKLFRTCLGYNPIDYSKRLRVVSAMVALMEGDLPIPRVAKSVGITPAYLATIFREILGITPTEYRRMAHKE